MKPSPEEEFRRLYGKEPTGLELLQFQDNKGSMRFHGPSEFKGIRTGKNWHDFELSGKKRSANK